MQLLSTLRFNALSASRSRLIVQEVTAGTGFLAPITGVTTEVARTRALAERAFYMIKRMPLLLGWQAETTVEDVLLQPAGQQRHAHRGGVAASHCQGTGGHLPRPERTGGEGDQAARSVSPRRL